MEEISNFAEQLDAAVSKKLKWFDTELLPQTLDAYRLLFSCTKTINDNLVKKSIIVPDPYKLDRRISEVVVPETGAFADQDIPEQIGQRLSTYEVMLDFVCNYYRFTVENLPVSKIKILVELNKCFQWDSLNTNSSSPNTRGLASAISDAKRNAPSITVSMYNDSTEKCSTNAVIIAKNLAELANFQREYYKNDVRNKVITHSDFKKDVAYSSIENEVAEIKRLFPKVYGKKPFYTDLVTEIATEDQSEDKEKLQSKVLSKLGIKETSVKRERKGPNSKEMLLSTVVTLGALSPIIAQLYTKLVENFDLLFYVKKTFFRKLMGALKKALNIPDKERSCTVPVIDQKTGNKTMEKIKVNDLLEELDSKKRVYAGLAAKGAEYEKVASANETMILTFINKQISENQTLFTNINALDDYFKSNVEILLRPKVKGMKIDLSSYRNAIINVNKKRGEYVSLREESDQMRKLGIVNNGKGK